MTLKKIQMSIIIVLLFTSLFAQVKNEILGFDAKTGKKYKIIITEKFDPLTGELITIQDTTYVDNDAFRITIQQKPDPVLTTEVFDFAFDPITGLEVRSTDLTVISLARATAKQNFQKAPWVMIGGPATCGTMIAGGTFGAMVFNTPGFLIGTVGMGILTPKALANLVTPQSIIYPESITYRERALYEEHYKKAMKGQRSTAIYNGALATCGLTAILGFFLIMNM